MCDVVLACCGGVFVVCRDVWLGGVCVRALLPAKSAADLTVVEIETAIANLGGQIPVLTELVESYSQGKAVHGKIVHKYHF